MNETAIVLKFFHLLVDSEKIGLQLSIDHGFFKLGLNGEGLEYSYLTLDNVESFINTWKEGFQYME